MLKIITRFAARKIAANIIADLDETQAKLDKVRYNQPSNGLLQLHMDRHQADLDVERAIVQSHLANVI